MNPAIDNPQAVDAREYLRPIWRRKWLIAALVIVVTVGTYEYYRHRQKEYTATTSVLIEQPSTQSLLDPTAAPPDAADIADEARLLQTLPIAVGVAHALKYHGSPTTLLNDIQVTPDTTDNFFTISATLPSAVLAARLINTFASVFIANGRAQTSAGVADDLKVVDKQIATRTAYLHKLHRPLGADLQLSQLTSEQEALQLEGALPSSTVLQPESAQVPPSPVSPRPTRDALLAFGLALLLGIVGAYALERFDRRISGLGELEPLLESQLLGAVPRAKDPIVAATGENGGQAEVREAFRTLRATLAYSSANGGAPRSLLVTSAVAGEGKTTVVRNLASAYAEVGLDVAVVDCDLRRAELGKTLGFAGDRGLVDVVEGRATLREVRRHVQNDSDDIGRSAAVANGDGPATSRGSIDAITGGTGLTNIPGLLASSRLREVLAEVKQVYDMVIIDTPPLLSVSDAVALIPQVDGVVLVSRMGTATDEQAAAVHAVISRIEGAHLLGVVANGVRGHGVYAGAYGYGY